MKTQILIVDDELDIQSSLSYALKDEGYEVLTASSPKEAELILAQHQIHVGLFDVWFPEGDGMELLQVAREKSPISSIVMMSGHGNIELALKSIRLGAFDFLEKPLELEKVLVVLNNASEVSRLKIENMKLQSNLLDEFAVSSSLRILAEKIEKSYLSTKSPLLLFGETGVGKHTLCRWLHSKVAERQPFVNLHGASIDESRWQETFEGSDGRPGAIKESLGGVLYLSDVDRLPPSAQAFLTSLLASGHFAKSNRLIVSSTRSEREWKEISQVRNDFRSHLGSLSFSIPSLKELAPEFPEIVRRLLKTLTKVHDGANLEVTPSFLQTLAQHSWTGNIRELKNYLERILLLRDPDDGIQSLSDRDIPEDFPVVGETAETTSDPPLAGTLREVRSLFEKELLKKRMAQFEGNVTRAAESLGIQRSHLHRKLRQYGLFQGELS
jgi:two-component system, NtrC family, nitrogen regulation response regulator NtrX